MTLPRLASDACSALATATHQLIPVGRHRPPLARRSGSLRSPAGLHCQTIVVKWWCRYVRSASKAPEIKTFFPVIEPYILGNLPVSVALTPEDLIRCATEPAGITDLGDIQAPACLKDVERAAYRTAPRSMVTKAHGTSLRLANLDAAAGNEVPNKSAMRWIRSKEGSSLGTTESHR